MARTRRKITTTAASTTAAEGKGHFVSNGVLGRTLTLFPDVSDGQSGNYLPNQPSVLAAEPSRKQAEPCDFDAFLNYQFGWSLQGIAKQLKGKNF